MTINYVPKDISVKIFTFVNKIKVIKRISIKFAIKKFIIIGLGFYR